VGKGDEWAARSRKKVDKKSKNNWGMKKNQKHCKKCSRGKVWLFFFKRQKPRGKR